MKTMKPKGRHPEKALSAVKVRSLTKPGRYADGNGLYLVVDPSGAKRWVLRTVVHGRRRDMGLGGTMLVSLAEAREQATALRKIARFGGDPVAERRAQRRQVPTFEELARQMHNERTFNNPKHGKQWINTLQTYAFPNLGYMRVDRIDTPEIITVLKPIWKEKNVTADRVRQRIQAVLDHAMAMKMRPEGLNPARWKDNLKHVLQSPDEIHEVEHHPALDYRKMPEFWAKLAAMDGVGARALRFTILCATRSSEVRLMRWRELNLDEFIWTVPAVRMKGKKGKRREHRVALTREAVKMLGKQGEPDDLVFPSVNKPGRPLSDMTLTAVLKRMPGGRPLDVHEEPITVHGFRSTFRDWAGETTNHPREVVEAALAHTLKNKAEAAYARGDLFQKRRALMQDWAAFATGAQGKVVQLRGAG
jgi:integrase